MSRVKVAEQLTLELAAEVRPLKTDASVWSDDARAFDLSECEISVTSMHERMQVIDPDRFLKDSMRIEPWWDDAREVDLSVCEFPSLSDLHDDRLSGSEFLK